jgi:hypothetical protein
MKPMLAHSGDKTDDRLSRTMREFYQTNQRMSEKAIAVTWTSALPSRKQKSPNSRRE